jgi:hypothetical protein
MAGVIKQYKSKRLLPSGYSRTSTNSCLRRLMINNNFGFLIIYLRFSKYPTLEPTACPAHFSFIQKKIL